MNEEGLKGPELDKPLGFRFLGFFMENMYSRTRELLYSIATAVSKEDFYAILMILQSWKKQPEGLTKRQKNAIKAKTAEEAAEFLKPHPQLLDRFNAFVSELQIVPLSSPNNNERSLWTRKRNDVQIPEEFQDDEIDESEDEDDLQDKLELAEDEHIHAEMRVEWTKWMLENVDRVCEAHKLLQKAPPVDDLIRLMEDGNEERFEQMLKIEEAGRKLYMFSRRAGELFGNEGIVRLSRSSPTRARNRLTTKLQEEKKRAALALEKWRNIKDSGNTASASHKEEEDETEDMEGIPGDITAGVKEVMSPDSKEVLVKYHKMDPKEAYLRYEARRRLRENGRQNRQ